MYDDRDDVIESVFSVETGTRAYAVVCVSVGLKRDQSL